MGFIALQQALFLAAHNKVYRQNGCADERGSRCQNHAAQLTDALAIGTDDGCVSAGLLK